MRCHRYFNPLLHRLTVPLSPCLQMASTDQSNLKADAVPRPRQISKEEQEKIDQRREAKAAESKVINSQLEALKKERVAQAEAR